MAEPMKIRARMEGDTANIRMIVNHPMETGLRKDPAGRTLPAHYIQNLVVTVGGRAAVNARIGPAIATNPVFGFRVKGARAGEKVVVGWTDNKGEKRTDEATIG